MRQLVKVKNKVNATLLLLVGLWVGQIHAIGMIQSFGCAFSMLPECKLEQIQTLREQLEYRLNQKLEQKLILQQKQEFVEQMTFLTSHWTEFFNRGLLRRESLMIAPHLPPVHFIAYRRQREVKGPGLQEVPQIYWDFLDKFLGSQTGGGLAWRELGLIFVNRDLFPDYYLPMLLIHEVSELIFRNHFQATVIEYLYASKRKRRSHYLTWLKTYPYYVQKIQGTFLDQHLEQSWITRDADSLPLVMPTISEISEISDDSLWQYRSWILHDLLNFAGDEEIEEWEAKLPQEVLTVIKQLEKKTKKIQLGFSLLTQKIAAKIKLLHPRRGALSRQLATIDHLFYQFVTSWQEIAKEGDLDLQSLDIYWKQHQNELRYELISRLNTIRTGFADNHQFLAWMLASEGNDLEARPFLQGTFGELVLARSPSNCSYALIPAE